MIDKEFLKNFEEAAEETRYHISKYLADADASPLEKFVAHVNMLGVIIRNMCDTKEEAISVSDGVITEMMLLHKINGRDLDNAEVLEMYEEMFRAHGVPIKEDELEMLGELIYEKSDK